VWYKAERFVEGMHEVGDILTKISANCVINLHAALLSTCLFLWVIICAVITMFIFMGISCICCMYMFTIILVWICAFTDVFGYLHYIYIYIFLQEFCVYII
jgi:hypothetical protein